MGLKVMDDEELRRLTEVSNYVSELMNLTPDTHRPYVGRSAFAHKGGLHVDGISKDPGDLRARRARGRRERAPYSRRGALGEELHQDQGQRSWGSRPGMRRRSSAP